MNSYRCYRVYIPKTNAERTTDTLEWFPHQIPMPGASSNDIIAAGLKDITKAIQQQSSNSPISPLDPTAVEQLHQLNDILHQLPQEPQEPTKVQFAPDTKPPANKQLPRETYGSLRVKPRRSKRRQKQPSYYVTNSVQIAEAVKEAFEKPCEEPDIIPLPKGYAYKAVHPDTGELVEYSKLKDSSRGKTLAKCMLK